MTIYSGHTPFTYTEARAARDACIGWEVHHPSIANTEAYDAEHDRLRADWHNAMDAVGEARERRARA